MRCFQKRILEGRTTGLAEMIQKRIARRLLHVARIREPVNLPHRGRRPLQSPRAPLLSSLPGRQRGNMAARPALLSLELSGDSKSCGRKQQPARVPPCGRMQEVVSGCVQIQMAQRDKPRTAGRRKHLLMSKARVVG